VKPEESRESREGKGNAVVLDTNVLIASAFRKSSSSARLVQAVREGKLRMLWDEGTKGEIEALFRRIPPISWASVEALFTAEGFVEGAFDPDRFTSVPDPDDRKFAALAAGTGAVLVTMDAHLLEAGLGLEPEVLTPGAFEDRFG
jgi:predicted nucleic acid-binding protein